MHEEACFTFDGYKCLFDSYSNDIKQKQFCCRSWGLSEYNIRAYQVAGPDMV